MSSGQASGVSGCQVLELNHLFRRHIKLKKQHEIIQVAKVGWETKVRDT